MEDGRQETQSTRWKVRDGRPVSYLPSSIRPPDREPFLHRFRPGSLAEPLQIQHFLKNLYRACTIRRPHTARHTQHHVPPTHHSITPTLHNPNPNPYVYR